MKILFITDLYPIKSGETNPVRTLHNFVLEWEKAGNTVDVVKPNFLLNSFLRGKNIYKSGFYEFEGVKIYNINYFAPFLFNIEKKLPKEIDLKTYDLIIAHMPSGIIFANKLTEKHDVNLICGVHCSDIEVLTKPLYRFYFKTQLEQAYKKAEKIACRSFVLQKKISELYPELADKTFVAASGVSPLTPDPSATETGSRASSLRLFALSRGGGSSTSPLTVLTCANLIKRKNIDKLIMAIKDLEGFELTIIGEGKELNRLKKLANSTLRPLGETKETSEATSSVPLSLEAKVAESLTRGKILFLGRLPREEVFKQMQNSHIFILPSERETFGMVYLEAMANGCITVCSEEDGIAGIINNCENGFLTPPTVEGIKETLLRIKNSENLDKIRQNSLETVKNYTPEICAQNYLKNCNILP